MMSVESPENARILIVEDEEDILELVSFNMKRQGYDVFTAMSGPEAVERIEALKPDLVILDLMLPGMHGFQVCEWMQKDDNLKDIPVIMLTARAEKSDIVRGIEVGAVDYVTKPFSVSELNARVAKQLSLSVERRKLSEDNKRLSSEMSKNADRMVHADRLATLGTMTAGIIHEIKNVNVYLGGYARLLNDLAPLLGANGEAASDESQAKALQRIDEFVKGIVEGSQRIEDITSHVRTFCRSEQGTFETVSLADLISGIEHLSAAHVRRYADLKIEVPGDLEVTTLPQALEQILINLVNNAADAIAERSKITPKPYGEITIRAERRESGVAIAVKDNGIGMSEEVKTRIFENYFTTKSNENGTGLGLGIVHGLLEKIGGSITVESEPGKGSCFEISLNKEQVSQKLAH